MQIYVPKVSAVFSWQGATRRWIAGRTTIEEGHPILKGREHMVEPLRVDYPLPAAKSKPKTKAAA